MYSESVVFAQLMDFLPRHEFNKCVKRYRGNHRVNSFSCRDQFFCMAFVQLTYRGTNYRIADKKSAARRQQPPCSTTHYTERSYGLLPHYNSPRRCDVDSSMEPFVPPAESVDLASSAVPGDGRNPLAAASAFNRLMIGWSSVGSATR